MAKKKLSDILNKIEGGSSMLKKLEEMKKRVKKAPVNELAKMKEQIQEEQLKAMEDYKWHSKSLDKLVFQIEKIKDKIKQLRKHNSELYHNLHKAKKEKESKEKIKIFKKEYDKHYNKNNEEINSLQKIVDKYELEHVQPVYMDDDKWDKYKSETKQLIKDAELEEQLKAIKGRVKKEPVNKLAEMDKSIKDDQFESIKNRTPGPENYAKIQEKLIKAQEKEARRQYYLTKPVVSVVPLEHEWSKMREQEDSRAEAEAKAEMVAMQQAREQQRIKSIFAQEKPGYHASELKRAQNLRQLEDQQRLAEQQRDFDWKKQDAQMARSLELKNADLWREMRYGKQPVIPVLPPPEIDYFALKAQAEQQRIADEYSHREDDLLIAEEYYIKKISDLSQQLDEYYNKLKNLK